MTDPLVSVPGPVRPSSPWLAGIVLVLAIRLLGPLAVGLDEHAGWPWVVRISELWVVGGLVVWTVSGLPASDILPAVGRLRVLAVAGLTAMVFAGQFTSYTVDRYPFVGWAMYTSPVDSLDYMEILGVVDGEAVGDLRLVRPLALSEEPRAVVARIGNLAQAAAEGDAEAAETVDATLLALASRWDSRIDEVQVRLCTVAEPTVEVPSTCELIRSVPNERGS